MTRPSPFRVWLKRIHYIWVRAGLAVLVLMPVAMWLVFRPQGFDEAVMRSSDGIQVSDMADAMTFEPASGGNARVMLLPGCPVDPRAYAPLARRLAQAGYATSIVRIPYRCAPLPSHEEELFARIQRIRSGQPGARWVLAGHSRGAVHATRIGAQLSRELAGIAIMGSTHPRDVDYSQVTIPVLKISGTEDGVAPLRKSEENRRLLPPSTRWVVIDGGNHSQFAHYGFQLFDGKARISREEQQRQTVAAIAAFAAR